MGQTIAEKIFSSHLPEPAKAGDFVFPRRSYDDQRRLHYHGLGGFEEDSQLRGQGPQKLVVILDHYSPSPSQEVSRIHQEIKAFVQKHGCTLYSEGEGVCHQLIPEKGHVLPGQLVIGSDSDTTTYGALNAMAAGVGSTDIALAIHYGLLWFMVPPSPKIEIKGTIPHGVYAKDIILHIIGAVGADVARGVGLLVVQHGGIGSRWRGARRALRRRRRLSRQHRTGGSRRHP